MKLTQNLNLSPYDSESLLLYAFRYALGRMTYCVADVATIIIKNKENLSDNIKSLIIKEIRYAMERDHAGMNMDQEIWLDVANLLNHPDNPYVKVPEPTL